MIKTTQLTDEKTGEVCSVKKHFMESAFDEEKGYLFWARKSFTKSFHSVDYPKEMNDLDLGRMARLAKKIWSNTNMLGYRGNGGIKPYTVEKIGEVINLKPRQAKTFVDKMISLGVIAKVNVDTGGHKEVHFYVNPIYFFSSNRIPLNLYLIFRKELDKVLPSWVKAKYAENK